MKRNLLLVTMACAIVSCTGSGSGSGIGSNDTFGDLPSLFADKALKKEELKKKGETASSANDFKDIVTDREEFLQEFKDKVKAELEKTKGREVKHSFSDALKSSDELFYEVSDKITLAPESGSSQCQAKFTPKTSKDTTILGGNGINFKVYAKAVTSKGEVVNTFIWLPMIGQSGTIAKGTPLAEHTIWFEFASLNEMWSDFAQIVFCTEDEYDASKAELANMFKAIKADRKKQE